MKANEMIAQLRTRINAITEAIEAFERLESARSWRERDSLGHEGTVLRRRGRPPGSKNRPKPAAMLQNEIQTTENQAEFGETGSGHSEFNKPAEC